MGLGPASFVLAATDGTVGFPLHRLIGLDVTGILHPIADGTGIDGVLSMLLLVTDGNV
jgi:hypothetical protein